jgi:hypothetical protein
MPTRLLGLAAAVALGGVVLAACSSGSSSSTTTTGATPTTRSSSSTGSSTSTSGPATSTTAAGPARCATSALSGSVVGSSGAAGTIETTVALKSTAATTCVLGGYPGLLLLASSGSSLATKVVRGGTYNFTSFTATTVTLTTGGSVYFNIGYSDVPEGSETSCPTSSSLEVTPPNAYTHLVLTAALAPCGGGTLVVSPVFAAGTETQTTAPPNG